MSFHGLLWQVISDLDDGVGQLLTSLNRSGDLERTLLLFWSDNGPERALDFPAHKVNPTNVPDRLLPKSEELQRLDHYPCADQGCALVCGRWCSRGSTGGLRGRKRSLYEGGVRSPLLVRWPGRIPAGWVDRRSVLTAADLLPTLCAAAGVEIPAAVASSLAGEDQLSVLLGAGSGGTTTPGVAPALPPRRRPRAVFWQNEQPDANDKEWWSKLAVCA